MALTLVHHMAISNNTPLEEVAEFLQPLSRMLIIVFFPKGDSQVDRLLTTREDILATATKAISKLFLAIT